MSIVLIDGVVSLVIKASNCCCAGLSSLIVKKWGLGFESLHGCGFESRRGRKFPRAKIVQKAYATYMFVVAGFRPPATHGGIQVAVFKLCSSCSSRLQVVQVVFKLFKSSSSRLQVVSSCSSCIQVASSCIQVAKVRGRLRCREQQL